MLPRGAGFGTRRSGLIPSSPTHEGITILTRRVRMAGHTVGTVDIHPTWTWKGTAPRCLVETDTTKGGEVAGTRRFS